MSACQSIRALDQFGDLARGQPLAEHRPGLPQQLAARTVHESLENVAGKLKSELQLKNEPLTALLTGVDDGW